MSGLSEKEKEGCKEILNSLSNTELFALKDTVTNRMITVESVKEAVQAIISYSQCAEELLKRKKVHREVIFTYLANQGVVIPPNAEKHVLVKKALEYWKTPKPSVECPFTSKSECITRSCQLVTSHRQRKKGVSIVRKPAAEIKTDNEVHKEGGNSKGCDYQVLGEEFCKWFYRILNSQNPSLGLVPQEWGPQHFWEDAKLKFCYSTSEQQFEEYQGAELVSLRLLALVRDELLFLNPNLDANGLKCVSSPHGLVVVAVAGTIHRNTACLGIFEQVFGLIRAAIGNSSWKIKFVNLNITGQNAVEDGEAKHQPLPTLTYQSSELQVFYG
ncbi:uncharacterized protein C3orf38 homolog isoform X1 [Acipenser ruthenus]|uniref:uncharacterized protein C3orf38 homolog isoform X1 n=1 Tax=Acipenser ruthenus TaxID=7906 RepID=UPI0027422A1A|nr:uncharacterized protein C3orf38 homolog isoform X1 [Acipenser ruthenus]